MKITKDTPQTNTHVRHDMKTTKDSRQKKHNSKNTRQTITHLINIKKTHDMRITKETHTDLTDPKETVEDTKVKTDPQGDTDTMTKVGTLTPIAKKDPEVADDKK